MKSLLFAALAALVFCASTTSASAQLVTQAQKDAWMQAHNFTKTSLASGAHQWDCMPPRQKVPSTDKDAPFGLDCQLAANAPAPLPNIGPSASTGSQQGNLDEVRRREQEELARQAANRPATPAPAPTAQVGGCWTKHVITYDKMVALLGSSNDDASWYADMCMSHSDFAVKFSENMNWSRPGDVAEFTATFKSAIESADCNNTLVKKMVFISPTGQKGSAFGKCGDDDVIWTTKGQNKVPVWSETKGGGKMMVRRDFIARKP